MIEIIFHICFMYFCRIIQRRKNMVTVTDKAKERISAIIKEENYDNTYFVRVAVESGGCSGLSYKLNFDNEEKKGDQFFEDNGVKICLDIKSDRKSTRLNSSHVKISYA